MQTPRIQRDPKMTKSLVAKGVFQSSPLGLVDVGASGGIDYYWNVFATSLKAIGFDPLIREVERLNALHHDGDQRYYAYLVGYKPYSELVADQSALPRLYERTSTMRAQKLARCDYTRTYYDQTGAGSLAKDLIELDEFFLQTHPMDVDFVKIDTDGSDYQVLLGAQELLRSCPVMGVAVECQFHGVVHDNANIFSNIDRLLRRLGFSLFDIEVYRYSRAVFPKPFVYRIPAQTTAGQVLWADALYFRDAGDQSYEASWAAPLSEHKILKLACLFDIFGLEDCTAELLLKYRDRLAPLIDVDACLDLITPVLDGQRVSYRQYVERFDSKPDSFFPPA
ncbi:MAG TPA: FkbM family methyltransferase [Bryobacteraceae bacterium]|nr:FkbM family methyltransferase [Bryobacteraceae bacterium]